MVIYYSKVGLNVLYYNVPIRTCWLSWPRQLMAAIYFCLFIGLASIILILNTLFWSHYINLYLTKKTAVCYGSSIIIIGSKKGTKELLSTKLRYPSKPLEIDLMETHICTQTNGERADARGFKGRWKKAKWRIQEWYKSSILHKTRNTSHYVVQHAPCLFYVCFLSLACPIEVKPLH